MSDDASRPKDEEVGRAESLLRDRLSGRVWDLHVVIDEGGAVLQGSTFSYHCKQLAQHFIMQALGLKIRANQIEVRYSVSRPGRGGPEHG